VQQDSAQGATAFFRLLTQGMTEHRHWLNEQHRRSQYRIPQVPTALFGRGAVLYRHTDGLTLVSEGHLTGNPPAGADVRALNAPFVLKEYPTLPALVAQPHYAPIARMLGRSIVLKEDSTIATNPTLGFPIAYAYEHPHDRLSVAFRRHETTLEDYATTLRASTTMREYHTVLLHLLVPAVRGLADFHDHGYRSYDVKPQSLAKTGDHLQWIDLDFTGLQTALRVRGGPSTVLAQHGIMWGTPEYLPEELLLHRNKSIRDIGYNLDTYALGMSMAKLFFPDEFTGTHNGPFTTIEHATAFLQRDDPPDADATMRGLRRIAVRAMAHERAYPSLHECATHLEAILDGRHNVVLHNRANQRAWRYRMSTATDSTRRTMARTSIAVLSGLSLMPLTHWRDHVLRSQAVAASLEASARHVARTHAEPEAVRTFLALEDEKFRTEMRTHHMRQQAPMIFPYRSFPGDARSVYATGQDPASGPFLALLHCRWKHTKNPAYLQWYTTYSTHLQFDLGPTYSDLTSPALGRFTSALHDIPALLPDASPADAALLRGVYEKALDSATLALCQYHAPTKTFQRIPPGSVTAPVTLRATQEALLLPLLLAAARSEDLHRILDPTRRLQRDPLIAQQVQPYVRTLRLHEFYLMLANSGITVADALIQADGKTFATATISADGRVIKRTSAWSLDPGNDGSEDDQPVVTQECMQVLLPMTQRVALLRNVFCTHPPHPHVLLMQAALGLAYGAFAQQMTDNMRVLDDSVQRVLRYVRARDPLREYLTTSTPGNMTPEPYGALLHASVLATLGDKRARREVITRLFATATFDQYTRVHQDLISAPHRFPGIALVRAYRPDWICSLVDADLHLLTHAYALAATVSLNTSDR